MGARQEESAMGVRVGIVGVSGYGGSELLRLCVGHPAFEVVYASGETSAGRRLAQQFPALVGHPTGSLVIQPFKPEDLHGVDVLFASLPTGKSREPLARVPRDVKVVDVGGDHRYVEGWTYGLTELPGARAAIARSSRVADPGCYPAAAVLALAPLVAERLVEPEGLIIDAKTGVSGAGRGGGPSAFGYAETNEDLFAYGLAEHPHVPEMQEALTRLAGRRITVAFTPHLLPMTRGILATCYARPHGGVTAARLEEAARALYRDEPFVRIVPVEAGRSPRTKWATGSNVVFLAYTVNRETGLVVALAALDNLGKGASGQAIQNANLMTGQPETAGLTGLPLWP
jgi:N-acetyl-gamma-glutamyl-phosphate reductase